MERVDWNGRPRRVRGLVVVSRELEEFGARHLNRVAFIWMRDPSTFGEVGGTAMIRPITSKGLFCFLRLRARYDPHSLHHSLDFEHRRSGVRASRGCRKLRGQVARMHTRWWSRESGTSGTGLYARVRGRSLKGCRKDCGGVEILLGKGSRMQRV